MRDTNRTADAIIVGGGIIGCAIAEALAREKLKVIVLERDRVGQGASWAAAGMLAPQSETLAPGAYFDFCLASRRLWKETARRLHEASSIDCELRDEGMFYLAFTAEQERTLRDRAAWQRSQGLGAAELSPDEVLHAEPSVAPGFRMAIHFMEDHQLDPRKATAAYAKAAQLRGARVVEESPVTRIVVEKERAVGVEARGEIFSARWIILASGCWSGRIPGLPFVVPTYPVKGQMLRLAARDPSSNEMKEGEIFRHTLHSEGIYLVSRANGGILAGATEEHDAGFDTRVTAGAVSDLLGRAIQLLPALREARVAECWAGLRPGTPDRRPIIGASPLDGLFLATGHFRNGVLLAPITALRARDFILNGGLPEEMKIFSLDRFGSEFQDAADNRA